MVEIPSGMVAAKSHAEQELLDRPGVVGVGVGLTEEAGELTDVVAIKVYVEPGHPVRASLPATLEGHPVNVVEQPRIELLGLTLAPDPLDSSAPDKGSYNPLCGGISAGPTRPIGLYLAYGTLGAIVIDNDSGKPMLLSNWHVFAVTDSWPSQLKDISQPAVPDGPLFVVGTLDRAELNAEVDAAVAYQHKRDFSWSIQDAGDINGAAQAVLGMEVRKRGRSTQLTTGKVSDLHYSWTAELPISNKKITFKNQILIVGDNPFVEPGDSGSILVDSSNRVVGLLNAGGGSLGVANYIAKVTEALNVTIPRSDERPWIETKVILDKEHTTGGTVLANPDDLGLLLAWGGYTDKKINIAYSIDSFKTYTKTTLEQKLYGEPAIVVCSPIGELGMYMAWTGTDSALNVAFLRVKDNWWNWYIQAQYVLTETSAGSPGLARLVDKDEKETLVLAWRGYSNRSLNIATSTDGGKSFPNKLVTSQTSPLGPDIANIDGQLYLLWQGTDNVPNIAEITINQLDPKNPISLGTPTKISGQRCYGPPSMASAGERVLAWRGTDGDGMINTRQAGANGVFKNQVVFPESTVASPTLCRSNERLYMAWTGTNLDRNPNVASLQFGPPKKIT